MVSPTENPQTKLPRTPRKQVKIRAELDDGFEYIRIIKEEEIVHQATEDVVDEKPTPAVLTRININNIIQVLILIVSIASLIITLAVNL